MGYTIKIGELIRISEEDGEYDSVKEENHGPTDESPTSGTNSRWPSYSGWSDFITDTKLPHDSIICSHPGCINITKELLDKIQTVNIDKLADYNKERFIWFRYWVKWSFENCKTPVIVNS